MTADQDRGLTSYVGPIEVDWPRTVGYYGGIGLAVAAGVLEPPLALFIAAVPFFKLLNRPDSSLPERTLSQLLEGASKPVGGDAEATIRRIEATGPRGRLPGPILWLAGGTRGIWEDAQTVRRG